MKNFRFPLDRILAWRRAELDLEEARLNQRQAELSAAGRERLEWDAFALQTGRDMCAAPVRLGEELRALAGFQTLARQRAGELAQRQRECERSAAAQRQQYIEARRRVRLLETLRDRRLADWRSEHDRELEALASDTYLAQWRAK